MNGRLLAAQIVAANAVATASAAARVSPVLAAITNNTFAPVGELQPGGRVATVGLILGCEATDSFTVRVTVRPGETRSQRADSTAAAPDMPRHTP